MRRRLRVGADVDLTGVEPRSTPGAPGGKRRTKAELPELGARLAELQERLFAQGRAGGSRRMLVVLQGMDTAGKGGTIKHAMGQMDPSGCVVAGFRAPTAEERRHDFLWRIRRRLPVAGEVGIFDRSHYEDVLVVRVDHLAPRPVWSRRYASINRFERALAADGCEIVKVFLHISPEEQRERLMARLDDPTKYWKFDPRDIDERARWDAYRAAYEDVLRRCDADHAPWYVVPADRKWYRNWAVTRLLVEHLEAMDLDWPGPSFDVAEQRTRLAAT
jgi:PPK2 family polyphosphate:nucleotide phosphotransferase